VLIGRWWQPNSTTNLESARQSVVKALSPIVKTGYEGAVRTRTFMPELSLTLCGRPSVRAAGQDLALPAKSLALLAFLAVEPGPHSREKLTALLWGESPDDKAGASFRQALSSLRTAAGDQLRIDRNTVELDPGVPTDVQAFLQAASVDPVAAAATDIPGFLSGLSIRGAPEFDEWRDATRAGLMAKYRRAVAEAARQAAARQDWQTAASLAERWTAADDHSEEAVLLLMEARHLSHDPGGALAAFADFQTRIGPGASPGQALRSLARRIESGGSHDRRPEAGPELQVALIGREREWSGLAAAWQATLDGHRSVAVVEGPPGVGKTRLLDDFTRWVTSHGGRILRGRGFPDAGPVQYGPMVEVLRAALRVPGVAGTDPACLAEVARILPEVRKQFPATPAAATSGGPLLVEAVAELIGSAAEDQPIAVVVDDLHWADADSCTMLHYFLRRLDGQRILWLFALTPGELGRDDPPARLARVVRASAATRIQPAPFTADQVLTLVRQVGRLRDPNAGNRLAHRLHEITGGIPFFLVEVLKAVLVKGWLGHDPDTGEWLVLAKPEPEATVLSETAAESIAERIGRLPEDLHAILMSISVAGSGCPTAVLSHIHGISRLRAAAIGDGLVERALASEQDGLYRAAHPMIAAAVRAGMTTARQREFHRAIALALVAAAEDGGPPVDPGQVAEHAELGGEPALAFSHALEAARRSREQADFAAALRWITVAGSCAPDRPAADTAAGLRSELIAEAGWVDPPAPSRPSGREAAISLLDFYLQSA
jgi:DNA-binding SARP family transcriptional activator